MNQDIWQFVNSQDERRRPDVLDDFTGILRERVQRLQLQYETITVERKASRQQGLSRIVTAMVSAAASLASIALPIPSVAEDKLSDWLVRRLGKTTVDKKYPQLAWCYTFHDYRRLY